MERQAEKCPAAQAQGLQVSILASYPAGVNRFSKVRRYLSLGACCPSPREATDTPKSERPEGQQRQRHCPWFTKSHAQGCPAKWSTYGKSFRSRSIQLASFNRRARNHRSLHSGGT